MQLGGLLVRRPGKKLRKCADFGDVAYHGFWNGRGGASLWLRNGTEGMLRRRRSLAERREGELRNAE
jgi:hypothetical protein